MAMPHKLQAPRLPPLRRTPELPSLRLLLDNTEAIALPLRWPRDPITAGGGRAVGRRSGQSGRPSHWSGTTSRQSSQVFPTSNKPPGVLRQPALALQRRPTAPEWLRWWDRVPFSLSLSPSPYSCCRGGWVCVCGGGGGGGGRYCSPSSLRWAGWLVPPQKKPGTTASTSFRVIGPENVCARRGPYYFLELLLKLMHIS